MLKKTPAEMLSRYFFEVFKNKVITGHLRRTATDTPDLKSQF